MNFLSRLSIVKTVKATSFYGPVNPPATVQKFIDASGNGSAPGGGLVVLVNNIIKILIYGAGLFALINFILAGYQFIAAGGDTQKVEEAWAKIWQSLIGLIVVAGAFLLAALAGKLLLGEPGAFLQLKIYTP